MAGVLQLSSSPTFGHRLFLLSLLHLGCLFFCVSPASAQQRQPPPPRRRKISPFSHPEPSPRGSAPPKLKPRPPTTTSSNNNSLSFSIRSYVRRLFSFSGLNTLQQSHPTPAVAPTSPAQEPPQQLRHYLVSPAASPKSTPPCASPAKSVGVPDSVAAGPVKRPSFASRADVHPCASCGEVFPKAHLLDLHQAAAHAFSELPDGDSGGNIVRIIFQSGWRGRAGSGPAVHRILKIHHYPRTLARFEEHREAVRARAAAIGGADERCAVDGNERLRFYCATFVCALGREGAGLGTCDSQFCAVCGIVRHGFAGKAADGVATHATGWAAHTSLLGELASVRARRAMLVCRVVAGRVAPGDAIISDGEDGGGEDEYDSVVVARAEKVEGELVVFDASAVLPCFVIVYSCV